MVKFGTASLTLECEVRNKMKRETILTIEKIVMVSLDAEGKSKPHGKSRIEYVKDRLKD